MSKIKDISAKLRAGRNPNTEGRRVAVFHRKYERTGASVRFVVFNGMLTPIATDIQAAMYPNNADEYAVGQVDTGDVLIQHGNGWLRAGVPTTIPGALKLAEQARARVGVHDETEIDQMCLFLCTNMTRVSEDDRLAIDRRGSEARRSKRLTFHLVP
jgi:hypothetical protein